MLVSSSEDRNGITRLFILFVSNANMQKKTTIAASTSPQKKVIRVPCSESLAVSREWQLPDFIFSFANNFVLRFAGQTAPKFLNQGELRPQSRGQEP
jgi:hypothetical protein